MKNRIENFLVAQLTSNLSVAILTHKSSFDINYITYPLDTLKLKDAIEHCLDCVVLYNKEKLDKSYLQKSIDNDPISALTYLMETFKKSWKLSIATKVFL
ncbi:MAG: hypothetical protein IE909_01395 [Campylobacterales bacterium]|nr:hypothetical protein [Campylobacterales bacterium]